MLFRGKIAVYCENHTEHIHTLCGQNAESFSGAENGAYNYHFVLKGQQNSKLYFNNAKQIRRYVEAEQFDSRGTALDLCSERAKFRFRTGHPIF
jgi:hypothetical protein